ncbi:MAG: CotH kinase family protein, partial [Clostridia bacterium]|nr:CotH kinase family protein [Clostridia bacterium]
IEQPNRLFLKNHKLDPNGYLYTAENFNFSRYPHHIKDKNDPTYSKKQFQEILDIDGEDDHGKFIHMLDAVNNYEIDIDEILEKYFDKENYMTWAASNILFDNFTASNENFILYSPLNSDKWYFIPWDFDNSWNLEEEKPVWMQGISMYWNNVLHRRVFEKAENRIALNNKIEELSKIINKEQTKILLDSYYDTVLSTITTLPDIKYLPITIDQYIEEYNHMPDITEKNKLKYFQLLDTPMPFNLNEVNTNSTQNIFSWEESYDFQNDPITYEFELSKDKEFLNSIYIIKDLSETKYQVDHLEKGTYFWRVTAKDSNGNIQTAFNIYTDDFGDDFYGIKKVIIE